MKYNSGFTLWELVIVMVIIAVLSTMTVPTFSAFTQQRRSDVVGVQLEEMIRFARTEALRRNSRVKICGVNSQYSFNANTATDSLKVRCNGSTTWSAGIALVLDEPDSTNTEVDAIKVMRVESASYGNAVIYTESAYYVVNADSTINNTSNNSAYTGCFDIRQTINSKLYHLFVKINNQYGNVVKCKVTGNATCASCQ